MEIEEGRIRRNTIYYDGASFARQIGLLPAKGSLADRALLSAFNARARAMRRFIDKSELRETPTGTSDTCSSPRGSGWDRFAKAMRRIVSADD